MSQENSSHATFVAVMCSGPNGGAYDAHVTPAKGIPCLNPAGKLTSIGVAAILSGSIASGVAPGTSATVYAHPNGQNTVVPTAIHPPVQFVAPRAMTLRNLYAVRLFVTGTTRTDTVTVFVNGSATALVATLTGTGTAANDIADTVNVNAGDTITIQVATDSTATTTADYAWSLEAIG